MNQFNVKAFQTSIKATATDVTGAANCRFALMDIGNNNAAVSYVQVFNTAAANVTLGSTAPLLSFEVPANSGRTIPLGAILNFGGNGFSVAATTGVANAVDPSSNVDINIAF